MKHNNISLVMVLLLMANLSSLIIVFPAVAEEAQPSSSGLDTESRRQLKKEYNEEVRAVKDDYQSNLYGLRTDTRTEGKGIRDDATTTKKNNNAVLVEERSEKIKSASTIKEKREINQNFKLKKNEAITQTNSERNNKLDNVHEEFRVERTKLATDRDKKLEILHKEYMAEIERRQRLKYGDKRYEEEMNRRIRTGQGGS